MRFFKALLAIFLASTAIASSGIQGKWSSEREVGDADGKTYKHVTTITLREDGGVLTGSIVAVSAAPWMRETTGKTYEIQDGTVEGAKFSFKVVYEGKDGVRTVLYQGTVTGDSMKGVVKFRGIGQSWDLDAKRLE